MNKKLRLIFIYLHTMFVQNIFHNLLAQIKKLGICYYIN